MAISHGEDRRAGGGLGSPNEVSRGEAQGLRSVVSIHPDREISMVECDDLGCSSSGGSSCFGDKTMMILLGAIPGVFLGWAFHVIFCH